MSEAKSNQWITSMHFEPSRQQDAVTCAKPSPISFYLQSQPVINLSFVSV